MTTKGKHTKKGAGRHLSYSQEIDEELLSWVLHQRDLQVGVRRHDIRFKAFLKDALASRPPMVGWTSSCVVTPYLSGE